MALIQVSELSEFTQIDILFQSFFHKLVEEYEMITLHLSQNMHWRVL